MKDFDASSISLLSYLKIFFRRKELLIIPIFAGLTLGICAGIILPRKYRSETVILVQEGKSDNPLFNRLAVSSTVGERMDDLRESILGWTSLTELVKRLNLDKDVKNKTEFERLILTLRNDILIKLRGHNIINLAYISDDPEMTQAVVKTITEIFVERNIRVQNSETSDAITFIEGQLKVYKGKIKSAEIAKLQEQLDGLLVDSTEKHPLIKKLRSQMAAEKEELLAANLEYTEDINLDKNTASPIIEEIKKALDSIESTSTIKTGSPQKKDSAQLMLNLDLQNVVARDVGVNEQIYNTLLERLETAKITQRLQSSKEGTRYTILDPPRIPLKPFQPNKFLVALSGLFLGTLAGVGLVIGAEFLDKSFIDVEDAKNFLGVPLLGAISKINTTDSIRMEHEKERWLYSATVAIGVIVVVVTAAVTSFLK
ncbi:MAG TPA: hypothetical protein DE315_03160 [Candidatus Omnitrophica bacterium]|nr:hypothetical protein [Candidatus Omnitrophota bacterium]HCI44518.1 hypothetical protein [Candidatus Omnitrophota bacterium]